MKYVVTFHFHKVMINIVLDGRSRLDAVHKAWQQRETFNPNGDALTTEECLFRIDVETEGERFGGGTGHEW